MLLVARFVPIKRVDRFLRVANLIAKESAAVFAILGDGELRGEMLRCDEARALGRRLHWIGFEENVAPAMFASDVVMLTSDNEGTPVSLIQAHAARSCPRSPLMSEGSARWCERERLASSAGPTMRWACRAR